MSVRTHKELVPRTVVGMQQDPTMLEQLSKNITRQGITNSTLNYLRVRIIIIIIIIIFLRNFYFYLCIPQLLSIIIFGK